MPRICFVNKMDRMGADFYHRPERSSTGSAPTPLPLQLPIGAEADFIGVIDLVG